MRLSPLLALLLIVFNFFTGLGLKATIETIDNRGDFKTYMQNYAYARGNAPPRGPRREGPSDEGFVCLNMIRWVGSLIVNNLDSYLHCLPSTTKCIQWRPPQQMVLVMASKTTASLLLELTSRNR